MCENGGGIMKKEKEHALTPRQLIFVQEYIKSRNGTQAAIKAGYSPKSAEVQASRLLKKDKIRKHLEKVQDQINRDLREIFVEDAVKAYEVLLNIMNDPEAPHKVRLTAARDLLDRAGYKPVERVAADITEYRLEDFL